MQVRTVRRCCLQLLAEISAYQRRDPLRSLTHEQHSSESHTDSEGCSSEGVVPSWAAARSGFRTPLPFMVPVPYGWTKNDEQKALRPKNLAVSCRTSISMLSSQIKASPKSESNDPRHNGFCLLTLAGLWHRLSRTSPHISTADSFDGSHMGLVKILRARGVPFFTGWVL